MAEKEPHNPTPKETSTATKREETDTEKEGDTTRELIFATEEEATLFKRLEKTINEYIISGATSFLVNVTGLTYEHRQDLVRRYSTPERVIKEDALLNLRFTIKS